LVKCGWLLLGKLVGKSVGTSGWLISSLPDEQYDSTLFKTILDRRRLEKVSINQSINPLFVRAGL